MQVMSSIPKKSEVNTVKITKITKEEKTKEETKEEPKTNEGKKESK